jgi:hypothetical protein
MSKLRFAAVLAACLLAAPGLAQSQQPAGHAPAGHAPAGHALWVFGQVERVGADGVAKPLAKGDAVFEGDVIRSAAGSHAQFVMTDEALVAVRAETSVKFTKYMYAGREDGTERAVIELLKGGLRSVTGAIGRHNKENYQLKNEMHVIGIRGTDHETFTTDSGTFSRVTVGGTWLQGSGGRIDVAPGQVAFASREAGAAPLRLERTPEFMHLAALSRVVDSGGPGLRAASASDQRRLEKSSSAASSGAAPSVVSGATPSAASGAAPGVAAAVLPPQSLGETALPKGVGLGKGGRCDGPCVDPLKNNGKSGPKLKP